MSAALRFFETTGIPLSVVTPDGVLVTCPSSDEPFLPWQFVEGCLREFERQGRDEKHPLLMTIGPAYFLGIARLSSGETLLLGPASPLANAQDELLAFAVDVIYPEKLRAFCDLIASIPTVSYRRFMNALSMAVQLLGAIEVATEEILLSNTEAQKQPTEKEVRERLFVQREHTVTHTPQSFETGVLAAIEAGDVPLLKRRLVEPVSGRIGQMAQDALTQEKYTFVAFVTMITRAAMRGGLATETAFSLSDMYCQQMDAINRMQDINALSYRMALDFCQRVADDGKAYPYSRAVKQMCEYISLHLHEEITLQTLADNVGLCTRSASQKFREETGYSVPDYVHRQKMQEASHLLDHSAYGIADIASFLQYASQSYFTKVFREVFGVTPQQYRDRGKA